MYAAVIRSRSIYAERPPTAVSQHLTSNRAKSVPIDFLPHLLLTIWVQPVDDDMARANLGDMLIMAINLRYEDEVGVRSSAAWFHEVNFGSTSYPLIQKVVLRDFKREAAMPWLFAAGIQLLLFLRPVMADPVLLDTDINRAVFFRSLAFKI